MATPPSSSNGDSRPRKKRKLTADPKQTTLDPKMRPTERLDLTRDIDEEQRPQLERLLKVLHKKRKIVVIAGAGISVSAGIPDFRSSTGLFNSLRKEHGMKSSGKDLFDASVYQDDSSTSTFHDMVRNLSQQTKSAQPTAFHHLLATLANEGRLLRLYTQNVDGIDISLPPLETQVPLPKKGPWPKTVQLHGGLDHMVCSKCHTLSDFDAEQFNGPTPPACGNCLENDAVRAVAEKRSHGIGRLRPRMVLYNEHNPDDEAIGSVSTADLRTRPDAVIVAGTTLKVPGVRRIAREMCALVRDRKDGVSIWINNDPEPIGKELANSWDLVVKGPCDEVARHAAMRRWDDPMAYKEVTPEDLAKTKEKQRANVIIPGTPRKQTAIEQVQGQMMTPVQSPRMGPQQHMRIEPFGQPSFVPVAGTKRKSNGAQVAPLAKKSVVEKKTSKGKPRQTQTRKATATKSKAKTTVTASISNSFKVTKNAKKPEGKKTNIKFVQPHSKKDQEAPKATKENHEPISAIPAHIPKTPKRRVSGKLTWVKPRNSMGPISSSDSNSRTNDAPLSPEIEPFTPTKAGSPNPNEQLLAEMRAHQARPSPTQRGPLNSSVILN
jgi:NAD-dependent histone deacetylase SIR2